MSGQGYSALVKYWAFPGNFGNQNARNLPLLISGSVLEIPFVVSDDDFNSDLANHCTEEEEDESEDEELTRFNAALASTLKTSLEDDDAASDSDGSDMDDEQMMAIDPHLTKIFQERAKVAGGAGNNKKKESKDAKANMVNFKTRVLELLAIYLKREYERGDVLRVIMPVLECIRTTTSPAVASKANEVLIGLYSTCLKQKSFPVLSSTKDDGLFTAEEAMGVMEAIHEEVRNPGSKMHDSACSKASLFVAKTLLADDAEAYGYIAGVYANTIREYFDGDVKKLVMQPTFFTEYVSWTFERRKQKEAKEKPKVEKPATKKAKKEKTTAKEKPKADAESGARGNRGGKSRNRAGKKGGKKE